VEEAKAYLNGNDEDGELDDDDLESVAGGTEGVCILYNSDPVYPESQPKPE
jgi:hypothetical protein